MKIATATLESLSPYSQSWYHGTDKIEKESHKDYEIRTWRNRVHADENDNIFIPPMAFKNCLSEVAKYLAIQIPGKGKSTYTKHFEAGILVVDPLVIGHKKKDIKGEWLFLPSDGRRGSGKRVEKCMPYMPSWGGDVRYMVLDETVTEDVFKYHLEQAGKFIGIGRFRPRNNGYYGRFVVKKIVWSEE